VTAYLWLKVRHQDIGGHITAAAIRLAWHGEVHTRPGLAVLAAGTVIYAVGSVLMTRPYVSRPATLFIAVPIAAVAGMLVLGVLAIIAALLIAALENGDFSTSTLAVSAGGKNGRVSGDHRARAGAMSSSSAQLTTSAGGRPHPSANRRAGAGRG
jgi:hypothetical protein